jgi:hypothetical protein
VKANPRGYWEDWWRREIGSERLKQTRGRIAIVNIDRIEVDVLMLERCA